MHLIRSHSRIRVAEASEAELDWLVAKLTFKVQVEKNRWEDLPLWIDRRQEFPSGLLRYIARQAALAKFEVSVEDARVRPCEPDFSNLDWVYFKTLNNPDNPSEGWYWSPLREDQIPPIKKVYERTQGIIEATTGAGKGAMVVGIVAACPDISWGIFAPTNELIEDLYNRLTMNGFKVGRFTSDHEDIQPIMLVSYGKMMHLKKTDPERYKSILFAFRGIIVDEAHACASKKRAQILTYCINAYWRFGLSGTPEDRTDGRTPVMIGMLGPVVARVTYEELLANAAVSEANVKMVLHYHLEPEDRKSYTHFYQANIVNNASRNRLVRRLVKLADKPVFLFAKFEKHVKDNYNRTSSDGMNCEMAYGKIDKRRRLQIIASAKSGETDVVSTTPKVFGTGIDVPNLMTIINSGAGESPVDTTQMTGRGMRRGRNKVSFTVLDVCDVGFKRADGSPAAFEKNAINRMKTYQKKGYSVELCVYNYETNQLEPYDGGDLG